MGAVAAPGGGGELTVMSFVVDALAPESSVTVSLAVNVPALVYWWLAVGPDAVPPSPKAHEYEVIDPSGSLEADPSKLTVSGDCPLVGPAVNDGVGGTSAILRTRWLPWSETYRLPCASIASDAG